MVELNTPDVEWFVEQYGGSSLSWCLSLLLEEFKKAHVINPSDIAGIAARELKQGIVDERV